MRAMASSSAACQKPSKCRVTLESPPGRLQVIATGTSLVPHTSWRARAALAPIVARLPAYEGYGGVVIRGSQVESGSVSGFRSMSAARIAVTGRHTPYTNLLACVVWRASWIETLRSTNTRADSMSDSCRARTTSRATLFQTEKKPVVVPTPDQRRENVVCSSVRAALSDLPTSFTSLRSAAYRGLVSDGG